MILKRYGDYVFEQVVDAQEKSVMCNTILQELPEWFGIAEAVKNYTQEVKELFFIAVKHEQRTVGFLSLRDINPYSSEIHVTGILKEFQGRGLGTELIRLAEKEIMKQSTKQYLMVKTLGADHPDANYQKTRYFYSKVGFYPLEELKTLWGGNNPCLIMVKYLYRF